ncbi:hypothetical protein [Methylovulum psychrotolerans]|uniref:DUF2281 domain-containing protein n=1 Tax=Methylovulum psychrotolerans TaxID=1704499 RepID=A0A2S5CP18_9GAMM|nr:hypothetical protein [Methylovulum psychrotolerans]POZ52482.1 hypothetical protein AADEFJLK_01964 [Methylovulum psychrotolerans]
MKTQQPTTAHSLYALYETLPPDVQHAFLEELLQAQAAELKDFAVLPPKHKKVILGVMEGAFAVPSHFDDPLPDAIENGFYS